MTSITFRTDDGAKWGTGVGHNLTPAQVDVNFWNLKTAIEYLQENPPEAVSVSSVVQSANTITFYMTDGTTQGPFILPAAAITFRGDWAATTAYGVGDIIAANAGLYIVLTAHTSGATFDPGANDGSGADYYDQILAPSFPTGGTTGQVLAKASGADFDVEWSDAPAGLPVGGTIGQVLTKLSATNYDIGWVDAAGGGGSGSGGAATFRGALVKPSATSITSDGTTLSWSTEVYDTDAIHDGTNADRLTVPSSASYVRVGATVTGYGVTAGALVYIEASKNGASFTGFPMAQTIAAADGTFVMNFLSAPISVTSGDYFTLTIYTAESPVSFTVGNNSHFWMEVVA